MTPKLLVIGLLPVVAFAADKPKDVTFARDVLPVFQARCQGCHRPGEAAPMSLLSYKEARPWVKAIKQAVLTRRMPPWHADPAHGKFANDRSLSTEEIGTITAWVDGGAKEGNSKEAPEPVRFAEGWSIGKPDAVVEMPNEFRVPATGTVEYSWIVVPSGFTEDKWVEKVEVRAGDRSVVHHVVLFARPPGSPYMKDAKPGIPFTPPRRKGTPERRPDTGEGQFYSLGGAAEMVGVYVPGGVPYETKPGQARLIKAGSDIIFQMHYTTNGKETADRSRVGFVFAKNPPKERVINTFIMNPNLRIPPGAPDHKVEARVTVHEDVKVTSLFPHMHVRGKAFEYEAIYPTGESQTLLRVPKYDFSWQLSYYLDRELTLPKGTQIRAIAWYDNSPNNPHNPDPKAEVFWGDQTWEEMLAGFVDFVIPVDMAPIDIAKPKKPTSEVATK
jgi:mono/diheme cytochrome c family protein